MERVDIFSKNFYFFFIYFIYYKLKLCCSRIFLYFSLIPFSIYMLFVSHSWHTFSHRRVYIWILFMSDIDRNNCILQPCMNLLFVLNSTLETCKTAACIFLWFWNIGCLIPLILFRVSLNPLVLLWIVGLVFLWSTLLVNFSG